MDYKEAGVDIEKGDDFVDWLKESKDKNFHEDKIMDGIGGFASIFNFNFPEIKDPCLVSATDGIGTKLKLAIQMEKYDTLGQDLVAMCANDLICTGAQPLFFLDYFATSKLDLKQAQGFLSGLRKACFQAQMALMGGETAEMPGLYQPGDFDCAGFAVGVVDRRKILGKDLIKPGQKLIGVSSSGFHSNGYSLVRRLFESSEDIKKFGEKLLTPTALYVELVMNLVKLENTPLKALAHITGGGIHNVARILPEGVGAEIKAWNFPLIFEEAQKRGKISNGEMVKTFNCGVGLVLVVDPNETEVVSKEITQLGFEAMDLGEIIESEKALHLPGSWQS